MKPRSFFLVVVKVIAIFLLLDMFSLVAQVLSSVFMISRGFNDSENVVSLLMLLFIVILYGLFLHYLFFNTDKIVDKLGLDKHFQEEVFELSIHRSTVIKISSVVVGALFFADATTSYH